MSDQLFAEHMIDTEGFFITSRFCNKYREQKYGNNILVWRDKTCRPASAAEIKLYKALRKLL